VADLKLGPLPNQKMTRVTVMLPEPLKEELDAYAVEHSRLLWARRNRSIDTAHAGGVPPCGSRLAQSPKTEGQGQTCRRRASPTNRIGYAEMTVPLAYDHAVAPHLSVKCRCERTGCVPLNGMEG
jgi:hypothetical protein